MSDIKESWVEGETIVLWECLLSPHDFLFYVSKEVRKGIPEPYIHNSALLYALNRHLPDLLKTCSTQKPQHLEDRYKFELYSTPAKLWNSNKIAVGNQIEDWQEISRELTHITYNAVHTRSQSTIDQNVNFPSHGQYLKFKPLTPFKCFIMGRKKSPLIRLGKKSTPVRIHYSKLDGKIKKGNFIPSHPVNLQDLHPSVTTEGGRLILIPPIPLLDDTILNGFYAECETEHGKEYIALPDIKKFLGVFSKCHSL